MIILEPMGGLANRMRVIASGIWLKERLNQSLAIIWNENYELNCPFDLLFEQQQDFTVIPKEKKFHYLRSTYSGGLMDRIVNTLLGIRHCITEPDFHQLVWKGKLDILEAASRYDTTFIQTCQEFGDNRAAFKRFIPIHPIREEVRRVTGGFSAPTLGVHIRRTDHEQSIRYSPLELFREKMSAELQKQNNTCFFLCTDDPDVQNELMSDFGPQLITYEKDYSRQSVKGMQGALVELYSLAATSKIFGSYWSSFSDIASRIGEIPLEVLKKDIDVTAGH